MIKNNNKEKDDKHCEHIMECDILHVLNKISFLVATGSSRIDNSTNLFLTISFIVYNSDFCECCA